MNASTGFPAKSPATGRYERKYFLSEVDHLVVLTRIKQHSALFRSPYPSRWVNNIYFDDAGHQHYWNHVNGANSRCKVRIRWYGPLIGPVSKPRLEIKSKHGELGFKESWPLRGFTVNENLTGQQLIETLQSSSLPEDLSGCLSFFQPVAVNRYLRHYFVSGDGQVRLTVDTDLTNLDCLPFFKGFERRARRQEGIILEFKYPQASHGQAVRIAQGFPFRIQRISKYVAGLVGWNPGT